MKRILILAVFLICPIAALAMGPNDGFCNGTSSCTPSATAAGDVQIAFAYRSASTTAPSLPSGWTSISTTATAASGVTGAARLACRYSSSSTPAASGTFSNANDLVIVSYPGTAVTFNSCLTAFGANSTTNAKTSTTVTFNALSPLNVVDSSSWVAGFAGSSVSVAACTPSGMTAITNATDGIANDTAQSVSSWSSGNCTISSGTWISWTIEILNAPISTQSYSKFGLAYNSATGINFPNTGSGYGTNWNNIAPIVVDVLFPVNTSTPGTTLTQAIANAGSVGMNKLATTSSPGCTINSGGGVYQCSWAASPNALFTVGANKPACGNLGPFSVNNLGLYGLYSGSVYPAETLQYNNFAFTPTTGDLSYEFQLGSGFNINNVTFGGCLVFNVTAYTGGDDYDVAVIYDDLGNYVDFQGNSNQCSSSPGWRLEAHNGVTVHSTCIATTLPTTVFWAINFNMVNGGVFSSTYTSGGTIVGTTAQTCNVTFTGTGTGATGTVALTGTNTIAGATAITMVAGGQSGWTSPPTAATLSSGTATCSGTAVVSSVQGGLGTLSLYSATGVSLGQLTIATAAGNVFSSFQFGQNENQTQSVTNYFPNMFGIWTNPPVNPYSNW